MEDIRKLFSTLQGHYNQRELSEALGVTTRTLRRWETGEYDPPPYLADAIRQRLLPLLETEASPDKRAFKKSGNWSREQTILAFHFYCLTPFGQLHSRNKKIIELATLIGRTPSALAMKCVNFANLDPVIRESGRRGLSNTSAMDKQVWEEFNKNWEGLVEECEALRIYLARGNEATEVPQTEDDFISIDFTGQTRVVLVKQRIGQAFFRRSVLSSYGGKCCISGVSDNRLLIASHIVAWRDDASIRLSPSNGLCLSAIHDKAFDSHLFSLTDDKRVVLSGQLKKTKDAFLKQIFWPIDGKQITLPEKFPPEVAFIARHREKMLESSS